MKTLVLMPGVLLATLLGVESWPAPIVAASDSSTVTECLDLPQIITQELWEEIHNNTLGILDDIEAMVRSEDLVCATASASVVRSGDCDITGPPVDLRCPYDMTEGGGGSGIGNGIANWAGHHFADVCSFSAHSPCFTDQTEEDHVTSAMQGVCETVRTTATVFGNGAWSISAQAVANC